MTRVTRFSLIRRPFARSSAVTHGEPWAPPDSPWTSRIRSARSRSSLCRDDLAFLPESHLYEPDRFRPKTSHSRFTP